MKRNSNFVVIIKIGFFIHVHDCDSRMGSLWIWLFRSPIDRDILLISTEKIQNPKRRRILCSFQVFEGLKWGKRILGEFFKSKHYHWAFEMQITQIIRLQWTPWAFARLIALLLKRWSPVAGGTLVLDARSVVSFWPSICRPILCLDFLASPLQSRRPNEISRH